MTDRGGEGPRLNIWLCYGGGLAVGAIAWLLGGNWWAVIGAVVAWFVFYTFRATRPDDRTEAAAEAARRATEATVSRQSRRAAERRASKRGPSA